MTSKKHELGLASPGNCNVTMLHCVETFSSDQFARDTPKQSGQLLSAITMMLLAKNAEERYQTASGLEADLRP